MLINLEKELQKRKSKETQKSRQGKLQQYIHIQNTQFII